MIYHSNRKVSATFTGKVSLAYCSSAPKPVPCAMALLLAILQYSQKLPIYKTCLPLYDYEFHNQIHCYKPTDSLYHSALLDRCVYYLSLCKYLFILEISAFEPPASIRTLSTSQHILISLPYQHPLVSLVSIAHSKPCSEHMTSLALLVIQPLWACKLYFVGF